MIDIDAIKAANPIAEVIGRSLTLKRNGREYVGLCPFHGERTPSFTVSPQKGFFHCFGCGNQGDVIDFIRKIHNADLRRACELLGGAEPGPLERRATPPRPEEAVWEPIMPVPDEVPAPPKAHPKMGKPDHVARVLNQVGELLHLIYRWEAKPTGERKEIRPLCFDGKAWQWKGPPAPRPLYGLPLTGLPVLLVEGEKKRDLAEGMFDGVYDVISWPNGVLGVEHAEWSLLRGLDVVLWGDATPDGPAGVSEVRAALTGIVSAFRVVPLPDGVPDGWDVANAIAEGWTRDRLIGLVQAAQAVPEPELDPDPYADGPPAQPEPQPRGADGKKEFVWPDPLDLFADDSIGMPELMPQHIPEALWPFVLDTSERMGVEPASVALIALATCSAVINDAWQLQPKRQDWSWTEQARIWALIVGEPSILKSPVIAACTKPVVTLEIEARRRHQDAMVEYRQALALAKADKSGGTPEPRYPRLDRYMVEGTTVEALSEVLRDDDEAKQRAPGGKVLVRQDEMSEFFANLDRYKSGGKGGGDRGAYLRLFNGGYYVVDRVARGNIMISNWSASFVGGVQPGPIRNIAGEAAEDGLLQRFVYCVPGRQAPGLDREPNGLAWRRYNELFPALAALYPPNRTGTDQPSPVVLHEAGHRYRDEIDSTARAVSVLPNTSKPMQAALGKWPGLFARLTLTFHLIDLAHANASSTDRVDWHPYPTVVPEATTARVASYMQDILLPHMLRAEAVMYSTKQTGHARDIAGLILANDYTRITMRDIQRGCPPLRPPDLKREVMSVMDSLVAIGWLEPEVPDNPVKPVHSWLVNPKVAAVFAERRTREHTRRANAKEHAAVDLARYSAMQQAKKGKSDAG